LVICSGVGLSMAISTCLNDELLDEISASIYFMLHQGSIP